MNDTYGPVFGVSRAEASTPDMANEARAQALGPVHHGHAHPLSARLTPASNPLSTSARRWARPAGTRPSRPARKPLTDLKFANYLKEIYLDSDTKVACISGAPSEIPEDWFLTNDMKKRSRDVINSISGSRRSFSHAIFTPGYPGWLEEIDRAIELLKPDSMKGYTIGDNHQQAPVQAPLADGR